MTGQTQAVLTMTQAEPVATGDGLTFDVDMRDRRWQPALAGLDAQAHFLWQALALPAGEVCLVLADDGLLAALNESYRDKTGPTNVLSFPALDVTPDDCDKLPDGAVLGDIVMSYDRMAEEAAAAGLAFDAHAAHLLAHGLLHLLGHDHQDAAEAARMEGLESRLMLAAGYADPYADSHADPHAARETGP